MGQTSVWDRGEEKDRRRRKGQPGSTVGGSKAGSRQAAAWKGPPVDVRCRSLPASCRSPSTSPLTFPPSAHTTLPSPPLHTHRSVDDGSGDVSAPEFCAVAAQLGVSMSEAQALALFKRFGFPAGVMPFAKWADVFVGQPNRQMGQDMAGEWKGRSRLAV